MRKSIQEGDLSQLTTYQAGVLQATVHRSLQKQCDELLRPYGISKMQWLIIGAILDAGKPGVRISDLAEILGTNLPFMTNSLNRLQEMGITARVHNEEDSRSRLVSLQPSFAQQCPEIEATLRNGLRRSIYKNVSQEDFRTYMKVLLQLSAIDQ